MSRFLIIGLFFSSAVTLYAQAQQPNAAKLKVDAQKVVSIIREYKAKTEAYCQINCLGGEIWSTCSDSKAVGGPEPTALRSSPYVPPTRWAVAPKVRKALSPTHGPTWRASSL